LKPSSNLPFFLWSLSPRPVRAILHALIFILYFLFFFYTHCPVLGQVFILGLHFAVAFCDFCYKPLALLQLIADTDFYLKIKILLGKPLTQQCPQNKV
jgi:hypothetical protein